MSWWSLSAFLRSEYVSLEEKNRNQQRCMGINLSLNRYNSNARSRVCLPANFPLFNNGCGVKRKKPRHGAACKVKMTHFGQVKISPNIFDPLLQLSGLNIVTIFAIVECSRTSHTITRLVVLAMDYFYYKKIIEDRELFQSRSCQLRLNLIKVTFSKTSAPRIPIYPADHLTNNRSNTSISSITHSLLAICGHLIAITKNSPTADV